MRFLRKFYSVYKMNYIIKFHRSGAYDQYASANLQLLDASHDLFSFTIPAAAAGLEFRQPNTCDPESVAEVRTRIFDIFDCWIRPHSAQHCSEKMSPLTQ